MKVLRYNCSNILKWAPYIKVDAHLSYKKNIMANKIIIFFGCFIAFIFIQGEIPKESPNDILVKCHNALLHQSSVHYAEQYRTKQLSGDDTLVFNADCFLLKDAKDTFFNAHVLVKINEFGGNYQLYNNNKIYAVEHDKQTITSYDAQKGETWAFTSNMYGSMIWENFIEPDQLLKYTKGSKIVTLLNDTLFHNILCYQILIKVPDHDDISDISAVLLINKKDYIPIFRKEVVKFQGNYQYMEEYIKSYKFNTVSLSQFSTSQFPKKYKRIVYQDNEPEILSIGSPAPGITGRNYDHQMKTEFVDFTNKFTLLDFWYTSCHPCIKTIPKIEKIRAKYPSLQVIGLNCFDTTEAKINKIAAFKKANNLSYPIFLVNNAVADEYKVYAWPTLYIIGPDGKVLYSQIGVDEKSDTLAAIDSVLHSLNK